MQEAKNLDSVGAFFDRVLNAGDMDSLEAFFSRDVKVPQSNPGIDSLRTFLDEMRNTFSSPQYKVMDAVSEGEKVAVRFSGKATHSGRYLGVPPSGRVLKLWGVMMFRFESGYMAEFWAVLDTQGILQQLRSP